MQEFYPHIQSSIPIQEKPPRERAPGLLELEYLILPPGNSADTGSAEILWTGHIPCIDTAYLWHPNCGSSRQLQPDWASPISTMASVSAPVLCLFSEDGQNRLTLAASEVKEPLKLRAGIREEDATITLQVLLSTKNWDWSVPHTLLLSLDFRDIAYYQAIRQVSSWWENRCGLAPMPVPEKARMPLYSTWYSHHQEVFQDCVEEECRLAAELGLESVIVDDGWQTMDHSRGYAYCGDWEMAPGRFPDFARHVQKVHEMGLGVLIWYSVPFVGKKSQAWKRFHTMLLTTLEDMQAGVLDPRYPQVREYLTTQYEHAVRDWDLDGLKLDFIDQFYFHPDTPVYAPGMDCASVQEAVQRLLQEISGRLRDIKPSVMIEFRQRYIGPLMRCCGNMFRVTDCPGSGISNRIGIADLRLLSGDTAVHSDPVMFHGQEPAPIAALQILDCLFSAVQLSVPLGELSIEHRRMLKFWISFLKENVDILQKGQFIPHDPQLLYPVLEARGTDCAIAACYAADHILPVWEQASRAILINAAKSSRLCLRLPVHGSYQIRVRDCFGDTLSQSVREFPAGLHEIPCPTAGLLELTRLA